jgi:hypothetical protein
VNRLCAQLCTLLLAVAALTVGPAGPAGADQSAPTLNPTEGAAGTNVTASAPDWVGCSSMSVSGWGRTLATAPIESSGAFSLSFVVPEDAAAGPAQLQFSPTCSHSTWMPVVPFTVTATVTVERVFTTDADAHDTSTFITGYAIHYRFIINNHSSSDVPLQIHLWASGPGQAVDTTFPFTAPPGQSGIYSPWLVPDAAPPGQYTANVTVTGKGSASGSSEFTVQSGAPAALRSPFADGVHFHVISANDKGYFPGGYNNVPPGGACVTGKAPDHCANQLFALDLLPEKDDAVSRQIHAPVPGTIRWHSPDCLGMDLGADRNGKTLNLTVCHFGSFAAGTEDGKSVARGQLLGTRSEDHIHLNLDLRTGRDQAHYLPVPFTEVDGGHTFNSFALNPNHNGNGVDVDVAGTTFKVEANEWAGLGW